MVASKYDKAHKRLKQAAKLNQDIRAMSDNLATESYEIIQSITERFGITQRRLAELLDVSEVWICNVKHGTGVLSVDLAARLSNLLVILENTK